MGGVTRLMGRNMRWEEYNANQRLSLRASADSTGASILFRGKRKYSCQMKYALDGVEPLVFSKVQIGII